jgi:hypothetical protein
MNFPKMFTKLIIQRKPNERLFDEIIGCEAIKRLFRMALDSAEPVHILISGAPASAKTLFLQPLMKLRDSYFVDGSNTTKSGMIDYIFHNKPKYYHHYSHYHNIYKNITKNQRRATNLINDKERAVCWSVRCQPGECIWC